MKEPLQKYGMSRFTFWALAVGIGMLALMVGGAVLGKLPSDQAALVPQLMAGSVGAAVALAGCVVALWLYLLPAWIAHRKLHRNATALMVANALLGWTFLGWVGCLIWSLMETQHGPPRVFPR